MGGERFGEARETFEAPVGLNMGLSSPPIRISKSARTANPVQTTALFWVKRGFPDMLSSGETPCAVEEVYMDQLSKATK